MAIRIDTYYEENKNLSLKELVEKINKLEEWLDSDEAKQYEEDMNKPVEEQIDDNPVSNCKSQLKILRRIVDEKTNDLDESLKLSNGKYAADEETKRMFDEYMAEVKAYNEKVAKGEDPGIKQDELLAKYQELFYDESLEEKLKQTQENFDNRQPDTKLDDAISKIDKKLEEIHNKEDEE